jgi:hypothetical protein
LDSELKFKSFSSILLSCLDPASSSPDAYILVSTASWLASLLSASFISFWRLQIISNEFKAVVSKLSSEVLVYIWFIVLQSSMRHHS